jgi:hypothetical protein
MFDGEVSRDGGEEGDDELLLGIWASVLSSIEGVKDYADERPRDRSRVRWR